MAATAISGSAVLCCAVCLCAVLCYAVLCCTMLFVYVLCYAMLFVCVSFAQIFEEEYSVLYLDQGGALVAIRHTPLPIRHLW